MPRHQQQLDLLLLPQQQQQQQQQLQLVSRQQQQQQNKWSLRQVLVGMVAMLVVGAFAGSAATHINHNHRHQRNALRSSTGQPPELSASRSRHLEEANGSSDSPAAVFAMVLHRHGDRSPTVLLPNDPNNDKWPSGKGQLTPLGMSQLATLGQALYARYVTNFSLLSASYDRRDLYVRSTDLDRTLMSAQSLIASLYPPGSGPVVAKTGDPAVTSDQLQPVPVHTVAKENDPLLRGYSATECPQFDALFKQRQENQLWSTLKASNADFLERISRTVGFDHTVSVADTWMIRDPLVCDLSHDYTWPEGISTRDYEALAKLADFGLAQMFTGKESQRLSAGVLLNEMRDRLVAAASGQPQPLWEPIKAVGDMVPQPGDFVGPRLVLYSAHDTTLAAFLSAIDLFDGKNPPYGSSAAVELLRTGGDASSTSLDDYAVRVYVNHGVASPFAATSTLRDCTDPCPLPEFIRLTAERSLTAEAQHEACKIPPPVDRLPEDGTEVIFGFAGVVLLLLCCIVAVAVCKVHRQHNDRMRKAGAGAVAVRHARLEEEEPTSSGGDFSAANGSHLFSIESPTSQDGPEPAVAAHEGHVVDGTPNGSRSDAQAAAASAPAAVAAEQVVPSVRDDSDVDV